MCVWDCTNDNLHFPKICVYVCAMCSRDFKNGLKHENDLCYDCISRALICINPDVHVKYNVADLN